VNDPVWGLYIGARSRAQARGIDFSIERSDLDMNQGICPCCSREMFPGKNKGGPAADSPSVDRLDPRQGYVPGNVVVICWACNKLKGSATIEQLENMVAWLKRVLGESKVIHLRSIPNG
jgi:hypothetical protein